MNKVAKLISRNVTPKFTHDCDRCRFLGRLNGEDLYVCENGEFSARFGNHGQEYRSLGELTPPGSPYSLALQIARRGIGPNEYRA